MISAQPFIFNVLFQLRYFSISDLNIRIFGQMIRQFLNSDVIFQLCVLSLWLGPFFQWFCVEQSSAWLHTGYDEMAVLGIKRIPGKVHGTSDHRLDRHRKFKTQVPPSCDSTQAKACLVKDKASTLCTLLGVSDVHFVFDSPELIQKIRVQDVVGLGVGVIDKHASIFPEECDGVTCMESKVCI